MFTRKGSLALLTLACASAWSFGAASADATAFELGSYLNHPGGKEIVARDYAGAIKTASITKLPTSVMDPLVGATNLCVAYTATGAFPEARGACDLAVEISRKEDALSSGRFPERDGHVARAVESRSAARPGRRLGRRRERLPRGREARERVAGGSAQPRAPRKLARAPGGAGGRRRGLIRDGAPERRAPARFFTAQSASVRFTGSKPFGASAISASELPSGSRKNASHRS